MNPLTHKALAAAIEAGQAILKIYEKEDLGVEWKEDASPLTLADRAAHKVIMHNLSDSGIPVLSEEGKHLPYDQRKLWSDLWIVDPVDGTKEFIKRNGEFTVNIALAREGKPVLGVVLAPVLGQVYVGESGAGAWRMNVPMTSPLDLDAVWETRQALPLESAMERPFTVVASRSHMSPETEAYVDKMRSTHGSVELISKGSSLKLCMVAEGTADAYPRFAPTMEWDTAAGQAVCEASGCQVIDQNTGEAMRYNRAELLNAWFLVSRHR